MQRIDFIFYAGIPANIAKLQLSAFVINAIQENFVRMQCFEIVYAVEIMQSCVRRVFRDASL